MGVKQDDSLAAEIVKPPHDVIASTNPTNPLKELLPRQRRFLKRYLKTKDRIEAWKFVYRCKSDESALVGANRFLRSKPEVVDWLYDLAGLGDDQFAKVVREGMDAQRSTFYKGNEHVSPDHYARFKAVELGLKVRGKDEKKIGNQVNIQINSDPSTGTFEILDGEEA